MITDATVKAAIKARLQTGSGADTKVVTRQKYALKAKDWLSALRSISNAGITNGWIIASGAKRRKKLGNKHYAYEWDYILLYFRSIRENTEADNSDVDVNEMLQAVGVELEDDPILGFDESYELPDGALLTFDEHGEFQVDTQDTINNELHFVQARLTCFLTKQG